MQTLILSTCGTSLLTNLAGEERGLMIRYANAGTSERVPEADRRLLDALIAQVRKTLFDAESEEQGELSAELNGLLRYYDGRLKCSQDLHWLIATDTWLGMATAKLIADVLEEAGLKVEVKCIQDLRTDSLAEFRF